MRQISRTEATLVAVCEIERNSRHKL